MKKYSSVAILSFLLILSVALGSWAGPLFETKLPSSKWGEFKAAGFAKPVTGIIFRTDHTPCCGVPMGGISTGCIDIDASGTWGMSTIWSDFTLYSPNPNNGLGRGVPRRPPTYSPILGMSVGGKTYVLASEKMVKGGAIEACNDPAVPKKYWTVDTARIEGVSAAKELNYWGHYPVVDIEYETDAPVGVGMRAWSPFIPGDAAASNVPGAVFEVHLRNRAAKPQSGTLAFTFPGPDACESKGAKQFVRTGVKSAVFTGLEISSRGGASPVSYQIGVIGNSAGLRTGGGLGRNGAAWMKLARGLPATTSRDSSGTAAVDFKLKPNEERTVKFVLAWHSAQWISFDDTTYTMMYATRFSNAEHVVGTLAANEASILKRILAWQQVIYSSKELPGWLQDALINTFSLIPEDSFWTTRNGAMPWVGKDGFFGLLESPRMCPQIECIPCSWYGNQPIVFFFPELAYLTQKAYMHYVSPEGEAPFTMAGLQACKPYASVPGYFWQRSLNSTCYVDLVDRLWQSTGDDAVLREFYDSVKKVTTYTMNLRPGEDGIISMPKGNGGMEWFETGEWAGMCAHLGGLHLSQIKITQRMAERMGDKPFAEQCRKWFEEGSKSMEEKMWTGSYYLNFFEPETGKKSDAIMAYQLDGEWAADFHGVPGVFRPERAKTALETIKKANVSHTFCGAVNFTNPDGSLLDPKLSIASYGIYSMFPPEVLVLAMAYMYEGDKPFGLELARRSMENMFCRQGYAWDQANLVHGDTGKRQGGTDYYQNMMLWSLPAAIEGKDMAWLCRKGGLVDRVIRAGMLGRDLKSHPSGSKWSDTSAGPGALPKSEFSQAVIVNDIFDGGKNYKWKEHAEPTKDENNQLTAAGKLNLLTADVGASQDVKVGVTVIGGADAGIVLRFQDPDNYVLAEWTPENGGRLRFREKIEGKWNETKSIAAPGITRRAKFIASAIGSKALVSIDDDANYYEVACDLRSAIKPGNFGLYHESASGQPVYFDDFHVYQIRKTATEPVSRPGGSDISAPPADPTKS